MRSQLLFTSLAAVAAVHAQTQDAPVTTDNPIGAAYIARLTTSSNNGPYAVQGTVIGSSSPDGKGVKWDVALAGFPSAGGPFLYHVHLNPVPADGNCTGTGAHLDPYNRTESPPCDATKPETCQVGDLAGKHGKATGPDFSASYVDLYTDTNPSSVSFIGGRSITVHLANKTRIACANLTWFVSSMASSGVSLPTATSSSNATVTTASATATGSSVSPSAAQQTTNAGVQVVGSSVALFAAAMALVL